MHNSKFLMIQDALKKAFLMIFFVVLARFFSAEEFGQYQQLILIAGFFSMIFSAGIPVAVTYFYGQAKNFTQRNSVFKRFFIFQLFLLALGVSFLIIFDGQLSELFSNLYIETFSHLVIIIFVTNSSFEFFKNLSVVTNQLKSYLYITTSVQLVSVICNVLIVITYPNIGYILLSTVTFNTLLFILLAKKNAKYYLINFKQKYISTVEFKYIVAMGSVALVSVLNGYIDQIMVSVMLSAKEYASLKIGAFQIPFISVITGSLLTVMIPIISAHISKNNTTKVIEVWQVSIEKATLLLVPIVIFCLVFADEIIINFFGEKYSPAIIIFQVYMFQWLRAVVIFGGVMGAIGLENKLFKNTVIITLLNIVLNYIMILEFGVLGAAITTTFLNYFGALLLIKDINKRLKRSFFSYFPSKMYFTSLFISLSLCLLLKYFMAGLVSSIISIIIISASFYALALLIQMKVFYNDVSFARFKGLI